MGGGERGGGRDFFFFFILFYFILFFLMAFFSFSGSLTIPPCTENVQWFVMKESLSVGHAQLDAIRYPFSLFFLFPFFFLPFFVSSFSYPSFREVWASSGEPVNNRPVQPTNGRSVYQYVKGFSFNPDPAVYNGVHNWGSLSLPLPLPLLPPLTPPPSPFSLSLLF